MNFLNQFTNAFGPGDDSDASSVVSNNSDFADAEASYEGVAEMFNTDVRDIEDRIADIAGMFEEPAPVVAAPVAPAPVAPAPVAPAPVALTAAEISIMRRRRNF